MADRDWPLCRVPEGQAGNVKDRGFFLYTSRISHNESRMDHQVLKSKISQGFTTPDSWTPDGFARAGLSSQGILYINELEKPLITKATHRLSGPGMDWKDNGDMLRYIRKGMDNLSQNGLIIDI